MGAANDARAMSTLSAITSDPMRRRNPFLLLVSVARIRRHVEIKVFNKKLDLQYDVPKIHYGKTMRKARRSVHKGCPHLTHSIHVNPNQLHTTHRSYAVGT